MAATIRQIADYTGLSPMTVSRVLGGKGELHTPQTRERVLRAARKLRYRPNTAARAVSTGRLGCVALLLSAQRLFSRLPPALLDGIQDALEERHLRLMIAKLDDERLTSASYLPTVLYEWSADGVLLNYHFHIPQRLVQLIRRYRIPSVWINSKQQADCVYPDDLDAGRRATRRLLELGHRRIAYVDYSYGPRGLAQAHYSVADRQAGYEQAMRAARLQPRVLREPHHVPRREREAACRRWLKRPDRPTAIVCYGDDVACPALVAARALDLRVPGDLSIITFGDEPVVNPGLAVATMILPQRKLGTLAVAMLLEKIGDPKRALKPRSERLGCEPGATLAQPA